MYPDDIHFHSVVIFNSPHKVYIRMHNDKAVCQLNKKVRVKV